MRPKPGHLGVKYASVFGDASVVDAYHYRPAYPWDAIISLAKLAGDRPRNVLDVGCGSGDVARPLASLVDSVHAVDLSARMIERGKVLAGGAHPAINWADSSVETADLHSSYSLINAGESLHWMDWALVFPRFKASLSPKGVLAIVERDWEGPPSLTEHLSSLIPRYSTNREYQRYDLVSELISRSLFRQLGAHTTRPILWRPTIDEYIECRHSQNGLSRDRMGDIALEFDDQLRDVLASLVSERLIGQIEGRLQLRVSARVRWGAPESSQIPSHSL